MQKDNFFDLEYLESQILEEPMIMVESLNSDFNDSVDDSFFRI